MATSTQPRGATGLLDAGSALDAAHARNGEAGRVLVVDDDAAVRLVCAVNLEVEGLHVREVADGLDALEQARCERPDRPHRRDDAGSGRLQLVERLGRAERTHGMPAIFVTGEVGPAHAVRGRALGGAGVPDEAVRPMGARRFVAHELAAARAGRSELTAMVMN